LTIIELFDELSRKHHWQDETSKNIHYFDGWKTNQSWKINKKVILPFHCNFQYAGYYDLINKITDIEKVLAFLDTGSRELADGGCFLEKEVRSGNTKNIELKYITVTVYKKGTVHIVFKDDQLLQRFNIFGCQHKNWLPPSYGKKSYDDLNAEEKEVIDSFEGEQSYRDVCSKPNGIVDISRTMALL
jgi:hypothetical protein